MSEPIELASIDTSVERTSELEAHHALDAWETCLSAELDAWSGGAELVTIHDCGGQKTVDARPSWACSAIVSSCPRSELSFTFERSFELAEGRHRGHGRARLWKRP